MFQGFSMPWYFPWSESIKKRACRYLLQHYLGHFLKEKLTLEQLSVDLYNGRGTIQEVLLDVVSLNEALETYNIPMQIVDGFIGSISVNIPWSALVNDNTVLDIHNLELTIQPRPRSEHAAATLDSMFSSMTTSMQLAQECLAEDTSDEHIADTAQPFDGLEMFAQTIEAVLSRVKVSFVDTIIRLEHLPKEAKTGAGVELRIGRIEYFDDQANDTGGGSPSVRSVYQPAAIAHKNLRFYDVKLYCDEFAECNRTFSKTSSTESSPGIKKTSDYDSPDLDLATLPASITQQPRSTDTLHTKCVEPIRIAVLRGKHEVKLKIKQNEELPGPKLEVDGQLGGINVHLSPRQLHLLLEIVQGISSPGLCDDSNLPAGGAESKPMMAEDYERVERELQRQLHRQPQCIVTQPLGGGGGGGFSEDDGLTTQPLDDSDDEMYFDFCASHTSGLTSLESSVHSHSTNTTTTNFTSQKKPSISHSSVATPKAKTKSSKQKDSLRRLLDDPAAETMRYKLKMSFVSVIVLHEDPPPTPSDGVDAGQTSAEKLRSLADAYFGRVEGIVTSGLALDLTELRPKFSDACRHDHLCLLLKSVTIECNQKLSALLSSTHTDMSIAAAELVEAVFDRIAIDFYKSKELTTPQYSELLIFMQTDDAKEAQMYSSLQALSKPVIKFKMQAVEKKQQSSRRATLPPKTDIQVELGQCRTEVDITVIDRLYALLHPQPLSEGVTLSPRSLDPTLHQSLQTYFRQAIEEVSSSVDRRVELQVTSSFVTALVRFPIPDLRTDQGADKPWWRRCLRSEILTLQLTELHVQTSLQSPDPVSSVQITASTIHGLFQESPTAEPVSFVRVCTDEKTDQDEEEGFDWPRFVLKIFPETHSVLDEVVGDLEESIMKNDSLNGACQFQNSSNPSPFSSRKVMYENEEMVMPGNKQEMSNFQDKAVSNTKMLIELTLPNVTVHLPDKGFFELLYNRVINDILLWEPVAPAPVQTQDLYSSIKPSASLHVQLPQHGDTFQMCKSAIQYDSSSDSDEGSSPLSLTEQKCHNRRKQLEARRQSQLCFLLSIANAKLSGYIPLPAEETSQKPREEKMGEILVNAVDTTVFCVVNADGNADLQYLCVQAHRGNLWHKGCVPRRSTCPLDDVTFMGDTPSHLQPTIYLSEPGIEGRLAGQVGQGGDSEDMIAVALKVHTNPRAKLKEYQVAVGIRGATLRHHMATQNKSWIEQCLEFFGLVDYPILGYTPPNILTELHLHLWSCAVDYRPLYLPYRAVFTVETFSVTSNIIIDSPTSLLRFLLDDGALFLSNKSDVNAIDLKNNYVCVLDVGMFELSLRTTDSVSTKYPQLDLRVSNNIIHLRTCSDSCQALAELLNYIAIDGDLCAASTEVASDRDTKSKMTSSGSSSLSDSPQVTQSHMEQVHEMMADAMKEPTDEGHIDTESESESGAEIFFSPTDPLSDDIHPSNEHVTSPSSGEVLHYSADDEFCIIENTGLGNSLRDGEPHIRVLTSDPIVIVDHYLAAPLGRADQLRCPDNFPPAVRRYTLREMSLVWHMYGGYDFVNDKQNKASRPNSSKCNTRMSKTDRRKCTTHMNQKMGKLGWQARGGLNRNIDVLMELQLSKVRFQHEEFPENCEHASRQILLINDLEIRDRLTNSKINKFLYQYTSDSMPRQSHANMLLLKAVHIRPDPTLPAQECSIKLSVQPLRLNIDQDSLFFLRSFFVDIIGDSDDNHRPDQGLTGNHSLPDTTPGGTVQPVKSTTPEPVMGVAMTTSTASDAQETFIKFDELSVSGDEEGHVEDEEMTSHTQPIFFKRFVFSPDVPIRLDYHGKRVDMEQGTLVGLLIGLAQLNCSELTLKSLHHRHGLLGVERLVVFALNEWLQDIKRNQLPSILGGVGPMYSLVQLVQGVRDLFWLPVEQYRRDGRIVRGLQRGAHSFVTCTAMSALELTNRLVQGVQFAGEMTYDMLAPGPSVRGRRGIIARQRNLRRYACPADLREGISNAYLVITDGLRDTAETIVKAAVEEHEVKGVSGAVGGVLRQLPPTIVQPVIIATEATSSVLGGMRNQLRPDKRKEEEKKWKADDDNDD